MAEGSSISNVHLYLCKRRFLTSNGDEYNNHKLNLVAPTEDHDDTDNDYQSDTKNKQDSENQDDISENDDRK
eukprot:9621213-Ditylum_brightwellii.AAC.1